MEHPNTRALVTYGATKANIILTSMFQPAEITAVLTVCSTALLIGVLATNLYLNIQKIRKGVNNEPNPEN